jgi:predicted nucleotidyltransferase
MKSLNDHTIIEVKTELSKKLDCSVEDIRLFGSRITGGWNKDSDLDVAVLNKKERDNYLIYTRLFDIRIEIHFVNNLNASWLRHSL